MPDGYRIADAFVGLTLDKDQLRADLASLPADLDGEVDAAGRAIGETLGNAAGERISSGVRDGITGADVAAPSTAKGTESGDRFGSAFSSKVRAALAALPPADINLDDEYAQAKLDYIREELIGLGDAKVGVDISDADAIAKLTVLRTELDELRSASASVQVKVDTAAASVAIDKFLADTEVKSEVAGKVAGDNLSSGMASSASSMSPLIVSAIAGGLIAGGPVVSAASILLFGGLAAAAASNVGDVQDTFSRLKANVLNDVQGIAQETSGEFVAMAGDIQAGFNRVEPAIRGALVGVAPELREVVSAFMDGADTAIPAFTRAIQQGQPVVQGFDALVRDLGTGVAGFMDQLTAHSGAEGQVLSELGQTVQILLPTLGELLGDGAELGQAVLPVLNTALGVTSGVLHGIGPALPAIVAGFIALKVVNSLSSPLGTLSAKLQTVAADADGLTYKLSGLGAQGVSKLQGALPALAIGLTAVTTAVELGQQQVNDWAQAILKGGNAAQQAKTQAASMQYVLTQGQVGFMSQALGITNYATALGVGANAEDNAKKKAQQLYDAMSPLEQKQQDVTTATNNLQVAVQKFGPNSSQAAAAAGRLASANANLATLTSQVAQAEQHATGAFASATSAAEAQQSSLQAVATKASSASTQIGLLKGALDALTGKAVTMDQAEIAVTQAVDAATQAVQGHTAALSFVNGQIDLTNTKSAAASQILIQLAGTQHQEIATMQQQGATQAQVSASADQMRAQFIQVAEQMGANAGEAQTLADRYFGIPGQVSTTIVANDQASGVLSHVQALLAGIHDKDVYVRTYAVAMSSGPASGAYRPEATGGIMLPMASGGVIGMASGGQADVFQPNSPTVLIGDNRRVRESFIPQDDSPRSQTILSETAAAMGFRLVPNSDGGTISGGGGGMTIHVDSIQIAGTYDLASSSDLRRAATVIRDEIVKIERAAR